MIDSALAMRVAATSLLDGLDGATRELVQLPSMGRVARPWYFVPAQRHGAALSDLSAASQQDAMRLLSSSLSEAGFATVVAIMGLETMLGYREGWMRIYPGRGVHGRTRDPQLYFVTIYGDPGDEEWAWGFEGHHISLNFSIAGDAVISATPHFIGANPAVTLGPGRNVTRPLGGEEESAFELVRSLSEDQREMGVFSPLAPDDILQGNRPIIDDAALPLPSASLYPATAPKEDVLHLLDGLGIDRANAVISDPPSGIRKHASTPVVRRGLGDDRMSPEQQALLAEVVHHYVSRFPTDILRDALGLNESGAVSAGLRFGWAGGLDRGTGHYYCVEGTDLLIEFDNTQNGANHIHSALRSRRSDFGADPLRTHYENEHPVLDEGDLR